MERELMQDYLENSGMSHSQAESLSRILAEMATKKDLGLLRQELRADLQTLKAELTWRFLAMMGFFAAVMTVVDLFVD